RGRKDEGARGRGDRGGAFAGGHRRARARGPDGMNPPVIEGPALFEETQRFPVWVYALIAVVLLVLFAVFSMRQVTRVDAGGVTVRFGLIYRTSIPTAEIRVAEAVQYRPVRDYGGWGVKGRSARRA